MKLIPLLAACAFMPVAFAQQAAFATHAATPAGNRHDRAVQGIYEQREKDWRNGAVVYQVLVDRFAPSANLAAKRALYPAPKVLRGWDEVPRRGVYLEGERLWSHEIEFWGGDLASLVGKLGHVQSMGADVLYLNPIHLAYTNHKYDAFDYNAVSPEFGTRADVKALAANVHQRGMKLVLDGVFNHMGRNSPRFRDAFANPKSEWRDWFYFGPQYQSGARVWWLAENLPELNLENPKVRAHVYGAPDSVVRSYLRDGVDGWRLDVAVDIGFKWLDELTQAAHKEKPGSLVVGEIANYPKEWFPSVDGVMNFTLREIVLRLAGGKLEAPQAQRMVDRMVAESGTDNLLKSWLMLDNHDTSRIATVLPVEQQRRLAQVLQFTLPGAPNIYYGSEIGMTGEGDPAMRAPMRWDLVRDDNPTLGWTRQLVRLRKQHRALRIGDYRPVTSHRLFAFERHTDRARDTVIVLANPSSADVAETVMLGNSKLMNNWMMVDALTGAKIQLVSGLLDVKLPAHTVLVLVPELSPGGGYSAYKRVQ
ncbi:alpha-amylase family glycosyl hydrolase [Pseudoduganella sp. GCM10020061]|uniref:glycoside hydrolase family 13 protein n=1 Tax=Pseudoduganella sp. GCM10020061 TaxID=3317345 RepID=UPI00362F0794